MSLATTGAGRSKGQNGATPFVGAYDAIPNLVHVYEPARCTLSAYTGGALVRLRRDSDDAEADFSHVSAFDPELDVAAIAAWLGASPGYIVGVYDQITGNNFVQAAEAAQPLFVANIKNGHAGGQFNGTSHFLQGAFTIGGALSQPFSAYILAQLDAVAVDDGVLRYIMDGDDGTNRLFIGTNTGTAPDTWRIYAGTALVGGDANGNWNVWSVLANGNASQFWINGVSNGGPGAAGAQNPDGLTLGAANTGVASFWDGPIVCAVIADPSHTDEQRGAMQTAMNAYWGAY